MCSRMSVVLSVNNSIVSELMARNYLFVSRDAWPLASMYVNRMFAFFLTTKLS